jgi:hypothetical protein
MRPGDRQNIAPAVGDTLWQGDACPADIPKMFSPIAIR